MTKSYFLSIFLSFTSVSTVFAASQQFPDDLLYKGHPIDSLCFYNQENSKIIDLKDCGIKKEKYQLKKVDAELSKKAYFGYDWTDPKNSPRQGYSYYKIFPATNHQYWVYTINNPGGSGDFTSLNLVRRTNPTTLNITQTIASGGRCNRGIKEVAVARKNAINFVVNLTPYDLIILANPNKKIQAYDDLDACATCCAATALYKVDAHSQPQLKYAELIKSKNASKASMQGKYQNCFNKLFFSYINKNEMILNPEKIAMFAKQYKKDCVAT